MNEKKTEVTRNRWLVILAGGEGTRLWPISHTKCPKQFCNVNKKEKFIQVTTKRFFDNKVKPHRVVVITTNDNQTELARQQLLPLGVLAPNILQLDPTIGYPGVMLVAGEFIYNLDKSAVLINTPSDQYIVQDENFKETIETAIRSASNNHPTIVGVKITDPVTVSGCGHALYDPNEEFMDASYSVQGFIEKPNHEEAVKLLRADNSACNTGINVWTAEYIVKVMKRHKIEPKGLTTDGFMDAIRKDLRLAIGTFQWYDCGTLKSLYDISEKTPNHKNASLGDGEIRRWACRRSLFYAPAGYELHVAGYEDQAVIVNDVDEDPVLSVVKLSGSQKVRDLAEDYNLNKAILKNDFSVGAHNNFVARTQFSFQLKAGFVESSDNHILCDKRPDGTIVVYATNNASMIMD